MSVDGVGLKTNQGFLNILHSIVENALL